MSSRLSLLFLCFPVLISPGFAQQATPACGPAPAIMQSTQPNIFSEQQEQWLGEAMADYADRFSKPIKNPALNDYLTTIGDRLLAALPPTTLQFHFTVVESSEVNGYSLAGGRVYLTRKLVASAHSEDEIASVIAHEMGHILTHQFATETTADLRRLLGITAVSDRADIYKKFQLLVDARLKDKHPIDPESDDKQDQADRVAVYAMSAAGYRPAAYAEFWDRSFFVGGKTGSAFSDFFHATSPSQKRLRRIRGIIVELPAGCGSAKEVAASSDFRAWQHDVLENQAAAVDKSGEAQSKAEDDSVALAPIRLDVDRLRFSRDGKYIMAQDESSISVLSREPLKKLFRFDADDAMLAEFSPDSQSIVFATPGLHVEQWSIAQHKLMSAREVVTRQECVQAQLAPDGRTVACVTARNGFVDFALLDVESGNVLYEKKGWLLLTEEFRDAILDRSQYGNFSELLTTSLSADGNTLIIGSSHARLAFDLRTRTPIPLGGSLLSYQIGSIYCFQGNDKVIAENSLSPDDSGVFSFPEGKRLGKFKVPFLYIHSTAGGEATIVPGPKDFPIALADIAAGKYVATSRASTIDMFGTSYVSENVDGTISLLTSSKNGGADTTVKATLSSSPVSGGRSITLSPDGRYLAFSAHTRGTVWDTQTGKQVFLMHAFSGGFWTPDGKLLGQFPKRADAPRAIRQITMTPPKSEDFSYKLDDYAYLESGHVMKWKFEKNTYTVTASSPQDASILWTRSFPTDRLGYTNNLGDPDLIFDYRLDSNSIKDRLKADPAAKVKAAAVKDKTTARLIELVKSTDGTTRSQTVIEIPRSFDSVDGFNTAGGQLYLSTGDNRIIVYSLESGQQLRQLFGFLAAADPVSGTICTRNRRDELTVLSKTGVELAHLKLSSPVRYTVFRNDGSQLLVFTADQHLHRFKIGS